VLEGKEKAVREAFEQGSHAAGKRDIALVKNTATVWFIFFSLSLMVTVL